jgi:hypothetical protein
MKASIINGLPAKTSAIVIDPVPGQPDPLNEIMQLRSFQSKKHPKVEIRQLFQFHIVRVKFLVRQHSSLRLQPRICLESGIHALELVGNHGLQVIGSTSPKLVLIPLC